MNCDSDPRTAPTKVEHVGQAILALCEQLGLRYLFLTGGTDLAPIQDGLVKLEVERCGKVGVIPINVPHETVSTAMALGYGMYTGKPAAVAVHVHVGTSNSLGNLINAHRSRIPLILIAGKTPKTEYGHIGSRDYWIHWGQDVYDQPGILREFVKWEYEITRKENLAEVIARAFKISQSDPQGPVYLTFGREILMDQMESLNVPDGRIYRAVEPSAASIDQVQKVADLIWNSKEPLIIAGSVGRNPNATRELVSICNLFALPVSESVRTYANYPTSDYCHVGFETNELIQGADFILVLDCIVPWIPSRGRPKEDAKIVLVDQNPSFSEIPMWSFPVDLALRSDSYYFLHSLRKVLEQKLEKADPLFKEQVENRRYRLKNRHNTWKSKAKERANAHSKDKPIDMIWLSRIISETLQKEDDFILVNEYSLDQDQVEITNPKKYFGQVASGYLGRGLGQALGLKLASPTSLIVACVGDGSYLFSVPEAAHWVSQAYDLPFLTVIFNNQGWAAERSPIDRLYPDGWSVRHSKYIGVYIDPPGQYSKIVEAFGGFGERVEEPGEIADAMQRAISYIKKEKKQALLDVICKRA